MVVGYNQFIFRSNGKSMVVSVNLVRFETIVNNFGGISLLTDTNSMGKLQKWLWFFKEIFFVHNDLATWCNTIVGPRCRPLVIRSTAVGFQAIVTKILDISIQTNRFYTLVLCAVRTSKYCYANETLSRWVDVYSQITARFVHKYSDALNILNISVLGGLQRIATVNAEHGITAH